MGNLFMGILDLLMPLGAFYNTSYSEIIFCIGFSTFFFFTYFEECYQEKKKIFFLKAFLP